MNRILFTIACLISFVFSFTTILANSSSQGFKIVHNQAELCMNRMHILSTNSTGNYTFEWFPKNLFKNPKTPTVSLLTTKSVQVFVVRTHPDGVKDTARTNLIIKEERGEIVGNTEFCEGDVTTLGLPNNYQNPVWSTGETTNEITVSKAGIYRVVCQKGCTRIVAEMQVKTLAKPHAVITNFSDLEVCKGETVELGAFGEFDNYEWSTGSQKKNIVVSTSQVVTLKVRNRCGQDVDSKTVTIQEVDANFILSALEGETPFSLDLFNESEGKANNRWSINGEEFSNEKDAQITIYEEGEHEVMLERTSEIGCKQKMSYKVAAKASNKGVQTDELVVVPNAFTPNGDGKNDIFGFQSNLIDEVWFSVFDRWGKIIHEGSGFEGWNGVSFSGEIAPQGMYVVHYQYRDLDGQLVNKYSDLQLIR